MTQQQIQNAKVTAVRTILNDLGMTITEDFELTDQWLTVIPKTAVSTSKAGVLALMIKELDVEVRIGFSDDQLHLQYQFSYTHPNGGTNGYDVRKAIEVV